MTLSKRASQITPSVVFGILQKAEEMNARGENVINFSVGEPDFKTPDYVISAAKKALDEGRTRYTATGGIEKLRQAICDKLKRDNGLIYSSAQIVVSNGCKQSLYNALSCLVDPADEVILFAPYWMTYPEQIKLCNGKTKIVKEFSAKALEAAITPKTKVVLINSPNNPSGAVYTQQQIEEVAKVLEKHPKIFIISDEIYEKLIYNGTKHYSIANYNKAIFDRTIVINGLSKAYAMTGWRVGYTASSLEIAKAFNGFQSHTTQNVNTPAQYAAAEALSNLRGDETISKMVAEFKKRAEYMTSRLAKMPNIKYTTPQGAFYVLIDVTKFGSAIDVANKLLTEYKIAVTPADLFGAKGFIRLSYALAMREIELGLDRLEKFLNA